MWNECKNNWGLQYSLGSNSLFPLCRSRIKGSTSTKKKEKILAKKGSLKGVLCFPSSVGERDRDSFLASCSTRHVQTAQQERQNSGGPDAHLCRVGLGHFGSPAADRCCLTLWSHSGDHCLVE